MYYKRISDLKPLGYPNGTDWNNIKPSGENSFGDSSHGFCSVTSGEKSIQNYPVLLTQIAHEFVSSIELPLILDGIKEAFQTSAWWQETVSSLNYITADIKADHSTGFDLSSEYYPNAIWFEVLIAKASDGKPVSVNSNSISKYQSKKVNLFDLISTNNKFKFNIDIPDDGTVTNISTMYVSIGDLYAENAIIKVLLAYYVKADELLAQYAGINYLNAISIDSEAISSKTGLFENLSGTNFYCLNNGEALNTSEISITNLSAENAHFDNIVNYQEISAKTLFCENIDYNAGDPSKDKIGNESPYYGMQIASPGVAEYFICDKNYPRGTLLRFGGTKEMTEVSSFEHTVAGVVATSKVGVYLNTDLASNNTSGGYPLPVLLVGRLLNDEGTNKSRIIPTTKSKFSAENIGGIGSGTPLYLRGTDSSSSFNLMDFRWGYQNGNTTSDENKWWQESECSKPFAITTSPINMNGDGGQVSPSYYFVSQI